MEVYLPLLVWLFARPVAPILLPLSPPNAFGIMIGPKLRGSIALWIPVKDDAVPSLYLLLAARNLPNLSLISSLNTRSSSSPIPSPFDTSTRSCLT
jgi:hypothetical protein